MLLTSRLRDFAASGHSRLPGEAEYEDKDDICVDDISDDDDDDDDMQDGFFDWPALKMTKCQTLRKF